MNPLPWFCRWIFSPVITGMTTFGGLLGFQAMQGDGQIELDYRFYAIVYGGIGFITGIAAWYISRVYHSRSSQ